MIDRPKCGLSSMSNGIDYARLDDQDCHLDPGYTAFCLDCH
jgi:hypothetical protein